MSKAIIAAGCFWGIEEYFRNIKGVNNTKVGYTGGHLNNPSYEEVCTGKTGHAEAVLIDYDEKQISYDILIEHFWKCHDSTQLNRQGFDVGTQYRSAIFYYDVNQKNIAEISLNKHQQTINKNIETEIVEAKEFYPAEDYHQCYLKKRS